MDKSDKAYDFIKKIVLISNFYSVEIFLLQNRSCGLNVESVGNWYLAIETISLVILYYSNDDWNDWNARRRAPLRDLNLSTRRYNFVFRLKRKIPRSACQRTRKERHVKN